jgi:hypothetical protein
LIPAAYNDCTLDATPREQVRTTSRKDRGA